MITNDKSKNDVVGLDIHIELLKDQKVNHFIAGGKYSYFKLL